MLLLWADVTSYENTLMHYSVSVNHHVSFLKWGVTCYKSFQFLFVGFWKHCAIHNTSTGKQKSGHDHCILVAKELHVLEVLRDTGMTLMHGQYHESSAVCSVSQRGAC